MRLTQKQETFCLKYFELGNATEAALIAGYSPKTVRHIASINLTKVNIQSRLQELRQKAEDAAISTVRERQKILTQIQRATVADFVDEHGNLDIDSKEKLNTAAVAEIKTERTLTGIKTTLKLRDPVGAIAEHNKMDKVYVTSVNINQDNRTVNIIVQTPETRDMLNRIGDRLLEQPEDDQ
jgi:phage terminase small subunit